MVPEGISNEGGVPAPLPPWPSDSLASSVSPSSLGKWQVQPKGGIQMNERGSVWAALLCSLRLQATVKRGDEAWGTEQPSATAPTKLASQCDCTTYSTQRPCLTLFQNCLGMWLVQGPKYLCLKAVPTAIQHCFYPATWVVENPLLFVFNWLSDTAPLGQHTQIGTFPLPPATCDWHISKCTCQSLEGLWWNDTECTKTSFTENRFNVGGNPLRTHGGIEGGTMLYRDCVFLICYN